MPKEEKGYWFSTENGTHIHAEEGESKESAMKKKFSKFGKKEESWKSDEDAIWEKFNKGEITEEERNKYLSERSGKIAKKDTTFEEINEKRMSGKTKKHDYSEIFDEDYQRSWGIPDFKDENDVKTLNDIVEKAMEYDGEEGAIDISNNAMDRISELVKFSPEEQDKLASGTGEEIMDILRSKEKKNSVIEEVSDDDIEVELADHEWAVTDKTTVGQYAEMVGGILGVPKERVLEKIKARSSNQLDESSLMYKVIDEDTETKLKDSETKPKYQSINDLSSSVKKELKEKGFNTKGISVRGRNVGYSDALDITIKDPNIDIDEVRKLVNKHESYERDASGDILQGGNRYVNVKYEYGLFDNIGEQNKEEASKLIEKVKSGNGSGIELGNKHYLFHDKRDGQTFIHSNEHGMTPIYSPERLGSYLYQIKKFGRIVGR